MEKQDHDLLMIRTWWRKVWTRRSLGHLVVDDDDGGKVDIDDGDDDDGDAVDDENGDYKSIMQTWVRKVWTRRGLGHLVVLPNKASTALETIFVVAKTFVVLFKHCVNISTLETWIIDKMDIDCIFLHDICIVESDFPFSMLFPYFDQLCIFRPSDAFFILCNILKRRSYAKVALVGASSCDTYLTIDNWQLT